MLAGNLLSIGKRIRNKREMVKNKKMQKAGETHHDQYESTDNKNNALKDNDNRTDETEPFSNDNSSTDNMDKNGKAVKEPDKEKPVPEQIEAKLAEMQDKYVRLSAEFDNYRKRTLREKMDMSKYAGENLLLKIIPLMDDFDRALAHMDTATDCIAMKNGIELIYGKFSDFLKQNGIKEIESLDTDFNVDLHEAVAKVPVNEDDKKGKVVDVVQKGYYLQDKILRFSKVVVGE